MADYWKSQAKKFCDFCKCWIADNKPSIGFHESGKRHKENVTKRLSEIRKNSAKTYQEEVQVDKEMKKMEEEALRAYMKDLQENPDYTSKKLLEETEKRKKELEDSVRQPKEPEEPQVVKTEESQTASAATTKVWHEAKSDDGYTYYWNTDTAESKWEPPEEGFVSLEEQELQKKQAKLKEEIKKKKKEEKNKRKQEEIRAFKERENFKKKRKNKDEKKDIETDLPVGPAPKPDPYGGWTVVEPKVEEPLDLELPEQEYVTIKVPELTEPEIKFKEKTFSSLADDDSEFGTIKKEPEGGFKKRKLNRGNMRQKMDTD
uniref:WW domain-containing protein n=1 Tax=Graphocephala atropunctata TaxID=36148 RepID=A0A1B6KJJ3_9HEMI